MLKNHACMSSTLIAFHAVLYLKLTTVELEDLQIVPALELSRQSWKGIEAASNSRGGSRPATEAEHDPSMHQTTKNCALHRREYGRVEGQSLQRSHICRDFTATHTKYMCVNKMIKQLNQLLMMQQNDTGFPAPHYAADLKSNS